MNIKKVAVLGAGAVGSYVIWGLSNNKNITLGVVADGEVVTDSTKKNLELRVAAEHGATEGKFDLAKRAKAANLDAIHDTVHEMAKDEASHGKAFEGLLKRYFG